MKRVYNPTLYPTAISNYTAGAEITVRNQNFFFSLYCCPLLTDIQSFLLTLSSTTTQQLARRSILCLDSNALNPLWNSRALYERGKTIFRATGFNIVNAELGHLDHQPANTSLTKPLRATFLICQNGNS